MTISVRMVCILTSFLTVHIFHQLLPTPACEAALQCYQCHGSNGDYRPIDAPDRDIASGGFVGNHRTHMDSTTSAAACSACHPGSGAYTSSHRDGKIKLSSRINYSPTVTGYRNSTSAFPQISEPVPGTCINVNCHFENSTPVWGSDPTLTSCGTCHGAPPVDGNHPATSGAGRKHGDYYGSGTASCVKCHSNHLADPRPFAHATSAGNRGLTVTFSAAPNNGSGNYSGAISYPHYLPSSLPARNGSCSSTYCHSPGTRSTNFAAPKQAAVWGGTLGCAGCHDAIPSTGSHLSHVGTTYGVAVSCYKCHAATVTPAMVISSTGNHVNRLVNVTFNGISTAVFGKYSGRTTPMQKKPGSGYANCENVYCHSNGQGAGGVWPPVYSSPKWGAPTTGACGSCHDNGFHNDGNKISSGSHGKHVNYGFAGSATGCGICHYGSGIASQGCTPCHNMYTPESSSIALMHIDRKVDVSFVTRYGGVYNGTPQPGDGYGTCSDVYCHSNGVSVATGTVPPNTSTSWGSGALTCNNCHTSPPAYANGNPKANSHPAHSSYNCKKCHANTTADGITITNTTNHVNKSYNVDAGDGAVFTYDYNAAGGSCGTISCHGNKSAQWGSSGCLACHSVIQGTRAPVSTQFGGGNSHHIQGAVTDDKCYQCHWEANSNGSINPSYHGGTLNPGAPVNLVIYGSGYRPVFYSSTSAITYSANGGSSETGKITNHCLGCHSDGNNAATPFNDGKSPRQYAWDGTSVAARYLQNGTTSWGKYTSAAYPNTSRKKIDKAYSAHGRAGLNQRGWDSGSGVDGAIANTSGAVTVQCHDCHNAHGSAVSGITSRYSSATGRNRGAILKQTVRGYGGYSTSYGPSQAGSIADKNLRNPGASICLDCHLGSTTKQAPFATFKGYTTPWGYSSSFGSSQPVLGYWDSPYMGSGTSGSEQRYPFKAMKVSNGGHFGASSNLSSAPASTIDGLCTPCHDPHGVSPTLGNNQRYAVPLLKGTFLTSPYKEDTAPAGNSRFTGRTDLGEGLPYAIDQNTFGSGLINPVAGISETTGATAEESQSAGLCLGCHLKESLTKTTTPGAPNAWKSKDRIHETVKGWKSSSATIKHNYSCSKCHSAHTSSSLPRLMVTNCLDSRHKGRSGWSDAKLSDSGNGLAICCVRPIVCSEIPYSFRRDGYADMNGGAGWCASNYPAGSGSGSGRIPGSWHGDKPGFGNNSVACHEEQTGSGTDQAWNLVTPWNVYPQISFTSVPAASVNGMQATIAWGTNIPAGSIINYGITADYGSITTVPAPVMGHTVTLNGLANHTTYHYQVKSVAGDGQQLSSGDGTFSISVPPTVPSLTAKSGTYCESACLQNLQWQSATDPDGGPIEYQVQADTSGSFDTPNLQTSPWGQDTGWSATLATNNTWYWRARARDANHPALTSNWSAPGSFILSNSPPSAPVITAPSALSTSSIRWNFTDTANNEDGFSLRDSIDTVKATSATPNGSSFDETGLTANTQYTRHVHAYNNGGDSPASASASRYTLSLPPNVTASVTPPAVIGASGVTFTNAAGFGAGGVQYYRTYWDRNPTYVFASYSWWGSGTAIGVPTTEGIWYFHVQSRNGDEAINGQVDYGPFYYDITPPNVTSFNATTPWNTSLSIPITAFTAADAVSGVTGFMITTTATPPAASSTYWSGSPPTTHTVAGAGTYTLYPWVKDLAGNVSAVYGSPLTVVIMMFDATPPAGLANVSPADNTTSLTVYATLNSAVATDASGGPVHYWFQIAKDSGFTTEVQNSGWQPGTSYAPSLTFNTTYYWRVKARDASFNETAYTSAWSFTPLQVPVTWSSKADFETNAVTSGAASTRNLVTVSGINPSDDATVRVNAVSIASGDYHAIALKSDGTVWTWGYNYYGQLGDGTTTQKNAPAQIPGLSGVVFVSGGSSHSLAIKSDGTVLAWGDNSSGQLGDGTTTRSLTPIQVPGLTGVRMVSAGSIHSLALKSDGTVWSWGYGQTTPVQVSNLTGVTTIAAGSNHSLAARSDGTAWSLGYAQTTAAQVSGLTGIIGVSTGNGRRAALKSDGTVWAWGNGPLGDGTTAYSSTPVQVSGLTGVSAVAAGYNHSMALKSDGTVWAWGNNTAYGLLGDNSTAQRTVPVQVSSFSGGTAISAGSNNSVAVKSDGTLWAWGYTGYGLIPTGPNYKLPVQCSIAGVTFLTPGTVSNLTFNAGYPVSWGSISWNGTAPPTTALRFRTRGAATEAGLASATWSTAYTVAGSNISTSASQWLETELTLQPNGNLNPSLDDFTITYAP